MSVSQSTQVEQPAGSSPVVPQSVERWEISYLFKKRKKKSAAQPV